MTHPAPDGHLEFVRTLERRLATAAPMQLPEHDAIMAEMFVQAQAALPPLAFHAWAACSFGVRRGLVTDEEIEAMGDDPYVVLFELERRGVLQEMQQIVLPEPRDGGGS
ncbi:hypothetical protein EV189_1466 [Motilibacter rhizosphaerae]|uniref:Uncharacterized protein n=1 Tax=Motilibacter rhizosphaerae TaxID=598652 RepID=A0A4Q7NRI2_9ACTN|nr:hypothetical protein [Motilibacter rhizosphaerae]RZS89693.1 hypothetical protein EV189_1466 [Motilibacter rhizosphaerae]